MGEEFWEGVSRKGMVTMKVSKEEMELFETIRKIKPAQWKEVSGFMREAKDVIQSGGLASFFKSEVMQIKDDLISMVVDPILAPILAELAPVISEIMEEVIPVIQDMMPIIEELAKGLADAIAVLKSVSVRLPGGGEWDMFWSGTFETFRKLVDSINDLLFGGDATSNWGTMMAYLQEHFGYGLSLPEEGDYEFY